MLTWAWRAKIATTATSKQLTALLAERGYELAVGKGKGKAKGTLYVTVYSDGSGGSLVNASAPNGLALAQALSRAMKIAGVYAAVDLKDSDVTACRRTITSDGGLGAEEDRNAEASALCDEWFAGKKYRPERAADLAAIFVDLTDGCPPEDGVVLAFERVPGRARVQNMIDAVRTGSAWEKTTIGGRVAIRIKDAAGTRISALDDLELAEFERGIA